MKQKSLRVVPTCMTCKHVFIKTDYDEAFSYFCHIDRSNRPLCGSVGMLEFFDRECELDNPDEQFKVFCENSRKWERWSKSREVRENTVCDFYEKKK